MFAWASVLTTYLFIRINLTRDLQKHTHRKRREKIELKMILWRWNQNSCKWMWSVVTAVRGSFCCWGEAFISIFIDCIQFVLSNTIHRINGQQIKENVKGEREKKNGNISIQANDTNCLACMRWDFHLCAATFRFLVPHTFHWHCVCVRVLSCFSDFFFYLSLPVLDVVAAATAAVQRRQVTIPSWIQTDSFCQCTTKNIAPQTKI